MDTKTAKIVREEIVAKLYNLFKEAGEDVGMITSGSFNFPVVKDGAEGFVEIVVKVPKEDGDDNYAKREEYTMKIKAAAEKKEVAAEKKAKKIERDKALREAKAKAKEDRLHEKE